MSKHNYTPTHDEIRERCHDIQRGWDRRERWKRSGKPQPRTWSVPVIHVGEVVAAMCDMGYRDDQNQEAGAY